MTTQPNTFVTSTYMDIANEQAESYIEPANPPITKTETDGTAIFGLWFPKYKPKVTMPVDNNKEE